MITGADPVADGAGPHYRVTADKDDVAGIDDTVVGHVDNDVAQRVRGADIGQLYAFIAHIQGQLAVECPARQGVFDAVEIEFPAHQFPDDRAGVAHVLPGFYPSDKGFGRTDLHFVGAVFRCDDDGALDKLIAIGVVAVRMGVHQRVDRYSTRCGIAHRGQHIGGQRQIEQGVDQQRFIAIRDQPGIAPAPAAIGQQIGKSAVSDLVQAFCVLPVRHGSVDPPFPNLVPVPC